MNAERLNEIYNKFPKVNLEKVELGLVEDFDKIFDKVVNEDISIGKTLISSLNKAQNKYKSQINEYEKAIKIGDKAIESAKDLGIDLPNTFKNKISSSKEGIKEARKIINTIDKLYNIF